MKRNPERGIPGQLRRVAVTARDHLDGRLHPGRRRRAAARLDGLAPSSVLFVCLGNICRSPFASRIMTARGPGIPADSAGFIGPGRHPPAEALQAARARGIEHSDHVSKLLTRELLEAADATFVFDRFNMRDVRRALGARPERIFWLADFDPSWTDRRAIADPFGRSIAEYEATFARIERCVEAVLRVLPPA